MTLFGIRIKHGREELESFKYKGINTEHKAIATHTVLEQVNCISQRDEMSYLSNLSYLTVLLRWMTNEAT